MSKTRRNHGSAFKAKVALEALKGEQTVAEIASKHGLHPTLVNEWKRQLADGASSVFDKGTGQAEKAGEALVGELHIFIDFGQLCSSKPATDVHGNRPAVFMISASRFHPGQHTWKAS
jgi:transposase